MSFLICLSFFIYVVLNLFLSFFLSFFVFQSVFSFLPDLFLPFVVFQICFSVFESRPDLHKVHQLMINFELVFKS